jgi:hypothetical protein
MIWNFFLRIELVYQKYWGVAVYHRETLSTILILGLRM